MKRILLALSFIFIFYSLSFSQNSGEQLLKTLQNKFNSISNLSANFQQTVNGKVNLAGVFFYDRQNKLRLELKNLTVVSDGVTSWSYNKKQNKVIISSYDPNDHSIISLKNIIDDYPSKCSVSGGEENGNNILILKPDKPGLNFKIAKIYVNSVNLIQKIILTDDNDVQVQIEFSNYKLNQKLNNSVFTFTPPKGSKVIDLR